MKCKLCFTKGHIRRNCPQKKGKHRTYHVDTTSNSGNLANLDIAFINPIEVVETRDCDTDNKHEIMMHMI